MLARKGSINELMKSLLSDYTEDTKSFREAEIRDSSCLSTAVKTKYLNRRQYVIAKTNSGNSRCYLQFGTSEL